MEISLRPDLQTFIEDEVSAGHYESAEVLIEAAIENLRTRQRLFRYQLDALRAAVSIGVMQADRGEVAPWDPADLKRRVRLARSSGL